MTHLELQELVKGMTPVIKKMIQAAVDHAAVDQQRSVNGLLHRCAAVDMGRETDRQTIERLERRIGELEAKLVDVEATVAIRAGRV